MRSARVGLATCTGLWLLGCSGLADLGGIPLEQELGDTEGATAVALLLTVDDRGSLPDATLADCEAHTDAFVWLAARREEPAEIAAALQGVGSCAAEANPADLRALLDARLGHEDSAVVGRALQAATAAFATLPADDPLVAKVSELARDHTEMPVRYEALTSLEEVPWTEGGVADTLLDALADSAPPVKSEALEALLVRADAAATEELITTVRGLAADDIDPGIRGQAVRVLAKLDAGAPETAELAGGLLDDEHPYARASGARALGELGDPAAVHVLVKHLDDTKTARWTMRPWTSTDGSEWVQHHDLQPFARVDDAVLRAIVALTAGLGEEAFKYREISPEYADLDIIAAARDARRWYEAHLDQLPEP